MSNLDSFLERNKDFAAQQSADTLPPSLPDATPKIKAMIIGCADMRVDPAHILGINLGEALVLRNIGGRVTPVLLEEMGTEVSRRMMMPSVGAVEDEMGMPVGDEEEAGEGEAADAEADPLYDEAVRIVTETRKASISGVQRRLKIGYNRAARLVEAMEAAGLVGPLQSNGGREIYGAAPPEE